MLKKTAKPSSPSFLNNLHVKKNKQPNLHALHFLIIFMSKKQTAKPSFLNTLHAKKKQPNLHTLHFLIIFMLKKTNSQTFMPFTSSHPSC
jgi:hypothetical protein